MKNIIITGGELFNKGAQAMTFIAVDQLKRRFPNHKIYVLSEMDCERPQQEKEKYNFEFIGWYPVKFAKCQSNPLLKMVCVLRNGKELKEAEEIYMETELMVDISGYALGSNWSFEYCNRYLEHLEFAKAFKIPVYLMPQSFGPFEFKGEKGKILDNKIRKLLPEIRMICAREQEGYNALVESYGLTNVCRTNDLVLSNKEIELKNIFCQIPNLCIPTIGKKSIGIIPNSRAMEEGNVKELYQLYENIIDEVIKQDYQVYLLCHSTRDKEICKEIKKMFLKEANVILFEREFSCLEFNEIVKQFEFVIASRFHSIVHAYKNGIPCISLGWAVKYYDLTKQFGQEQYTFDVRNNLVTEEVLQKLEKMMDGYQEESIKILKCLDGIQSENVFDIIKL